MAPTGLEARVYSATAGEIFWTRPKTVGLLYDVIRDGQKLATTDGTSWFDDTLAGGTRYTYEVIAIDRDGRRSTASSVTLTTLGGTTPPPSPTDDPFAVPDPSGTTTIARLDYPAARDLAAELISATYLDLYYEIDAMVPPLLANADADADVERVASCPDGGSARGVGTGLSYALLEFDGCVIEGRTLSGRLERTASRLAFGIGATRELTIGFDDLRIDAAESGTLTVTGSVERFASQGQNNWYDGFEFTSETIRLASARLDFRTGRCRSTSSAMARRSRSATSTPSRHTRTQRRGGGPCRGRTRAPGAHALAPPRRKYKAAVCPRMPQLRPPNTRSTHRLLLEPAPAPSSDVLSALPPTRSLGTGAPSSPYPRPPGQPPPWPRR